MDVSVIIPTYYRDYDLSLLLKNIFNQTIKPLEIIIVDDTPNESIMNVCVDLESVFKKINIDLKYIKNIKNRGTTIARNIGVNNSKGDIILFLDSDVILYHDYIERVSEVFINKPCALGVQGLIITKINYDIKYYLSQIFLRIFGLDYYSINSCKFNETPIILTSIINCSWLSGSNMALRKLIFNEFSFDENLQKYSLMEDKLFSHSIYKKYPCSLFITPYARLIHKISKEGRDNDIESEKHKLKCIKYSLNKLFGLKGLIQYYRQKTGLLIIKIYYRYISY